MFVPEAAQPQLDAALAAAASQEVNELNQRIELWKTHRETLITKLKSGLDSSVLQMRR